MLQTMEAPDKNLLDSHELRQLIRRIFESFVEGCDTSRSYAVLTMKDVD